MNTAVDTRGEAPLILVVDDDELTTDHFSLMLRLEGYKVCGALSAEAALAQVRSRRPDAIILDLRMPIVDGLSFLRQLRSEGEGIPVTVVTGDYFADDTIRCDLGALGAAILFKPIWLEELSEIVAAMLKRASRPAS